MMSSSAAAAISSPTFTVTSSISSFDEISIPSPSLPTYDSDDEIVWSVSDEASSSGTSSPDSDVFPASDDDFVVLSRPRTHSLSSVSGRSTSNSNGSHTPTSSTGDLVSDLANLSVNGKPTSAARRAKIQRRRSRQREKRRATAALSGGSQSSPPTSPGSPALARPPSTATLKKAAPSPPSSTVQVKKPKPKKVKKKKAVATPTTGLGARPIVDDISVVSDNGDEPATPSSMYQEATTYINTFLANPTAKDYPVNRLALLQSLIVELGIATSSLPASLTSAKAILKSRAFLNIKEYLAVREQGQEAVQRVMHPSRTALIKDIRKKGNRASLKWVKEHGLQVLLVACFH